MDKDAENQSWISQRLNGAHPVLFSTYCIVAAFGTYFCMYAFRKPFTAATYDELTWLGVGFKTILIASQVTGYTISKFLGIKFVSEMPARYRAIAILVLIAIAELALFFFAITPPPWNFFWLFINGLPLGMVFGLVLGFLEGRQMTEALSAGLCASFILASGFVKSTGRALMQDYDVDQFWMPFCTGLIFVIPLLICVWMLSQIPPPTQVDELLRAKRAPMYREERKNFFRRHRIGLLGLLTIYLLLTLIRSIRDDFAVEIWQELGVSDEPTIFAQSEFWVMVGVIFINGTAFSIKDNRFAFLATIGLLCVGFVTVLSTVMLKQADHLSPMVFMVLLGLGLYIPYVAFHTTVFERMLAAFRETGTIGYLMYLADAIGYFAYVGVMVFRNTTDNAAIAVAKTINQESLILIDLEYLDENFLNLMIWVAVVVSIVSTLIAGVLLVHYRRLFKKLDSRKELGDGIE